MRLVVRNNSRQIRLNVARCVVENGNGYRAYLSRGQFKRIAALGSRCFVYFGEAFVPCRLGLMSLVWEAGI